MHREHHKHTSQAISYGKDLSASGPIGVVEKAVRGVERPASSIGSTTDLVFDFGWVIEKDGFKGWIPSRILGNIGGNRLGQGIARCDWRY